MEYSILYYVGKGGMLGIISENSEKNAKLVNGLSNALFFPTCTFFRFLL